MALIAIVAIYVATVAVTFTDKAEEADISTEDGFIEQITAASKVVLTNGDREYATFDTAIADS